MKPVHIIKKFSAFLLLCVFAIGITPKQVLHDALTHHQHIPLNEDGASVGKSRFNCNDENFAAESPFVDQVTDIELIVPDVDRAMPNIFHPSHPREHHVFFELRGPPVAI